MPPKSTKCQVNPRLGKHHQVWLASRRARMAEYPAKLPTAIATAWNGRGKRMGRWVTHSAKLGEMGRDTIKSW